MTSIAARLEKFQGPAGAAKAPAQPSPVVKRTASRVGTTASPSPQQSAPQPVSPSSPAAASSAPTRQPSIASLDVSEARMLPM